ncbi:hypothetical protein M422DRAFT_126076, partial [Sphaerobolus stellatus SS14]
TSKSNDSPTVNVRPKIFLLCCVPFGVTHEKIGTIQRLGSHLLAWPLHKDDTLLQSGRPSGRNIYFIRF